jgi:hypothetical protein
MCRDDTKLLGTIAARKSVMQIVRFRIAMYQLSACSLICVKPQHLGFKKLNTKPSKEHWHILNTCLQLGKLLFAHCIDKTNSDFLSFYYGPLKRTRGEAMLDRNLQNPLTKVANKSCSH